jgi:hypothetical protein
VEVTELRVVVPEDIAERLAERAQREHTTPEDVAAEVLRLHVAVRPAAERFAFIGIGRAKPGFSAKEAEERLEAEGFG